MANYATEEDFETKYPKMRDLDAGVIDEYLTEAHSAIAMQLGGFLGTAEADTDANALLKHIETGLAYASIFSKIKSQQQGGGITKAQAEGERAEKNLKAVCEYVMGQSTALHVEELLEEPTFSFDDIETLSIDTPDD